MRMFIKVFGRFRRSRKKRREALSSSRELKTRRMFISRRLGAIRKIMQEGLLDSSRRSELMRAWNDIFHECRLSCRIVGIGITREGGVEYRVGDREDHCRIAVGLIERFESLDDSITPTQDMVQYLVEENFLR